MSQFKPTWWTNNYVRNTPVHAINQHKMDYFGYINPKPAAPVDLNYKFKVGDTVRIISLPDAPLARIDKCEPVLSYNKYEVYLGRVPGYSFL